MPRIEQLRGWNVDVQRTMAPEVDQFGMPKMNGDGPALVEIWTLIFVENGTGNVITFAFREHVRDELMTKLQRGIVPADLSDLDSL